MTLPQQQLPQYQTFDYVVLRPFLSPEGAAVLQRGGQPRIETGITDGARSTMTRGRALCSQR